MMVKKSSFSLLLLAGQMAYASGVIPDKREFPVNQNVSPCQNFYEHACSKVVENFTLPDDRSRHIFSFSDSRERLLEEKKAFLQNLKSGKKMSSRSKTLQTVYGACMDESARAKEERALAKQVQSKLGQLKNREDFLQFLAEQRANGYFSFVQVGSTANQDNPDIYDFYFIADMQTLPERSYYQNEAVLKDYQKLVESFFEAIGEKNAAARAKQIVTFEKAFAENYPLPAEIRELFVKKSSISKADIKKFYPSFRLEEDLKKVPDQLNIRHFIPDNFEFTERQLRHAALDLLKDLYLYQAMSPVMDDAYPEFFQKQFAFNHKYLGGPKQRSDRQERCTELVMSRYRMEIDAELLPQIFPDFPEDDFIKLAEDVRSAIIEGVKENQWLSEKGRKGAIAKLENARLQLVKPRNEKEWNFNPELDYSANTPLENTRRLNVALVDRMYEELKDKRDSNRWAMGPLTVNAYYSPSDNKFVMPIGILQYPFYDPKLPREINLGAVGAVIGHELGHGIDDKGAMYDHQGRLVQWMTDDDLKNFKKAGAQFIEQFDASGHDGRLTLGENIGDWTGLTFAYRAAFPEGKGSKEQKQAFYLQYARLWCGTMRPAMRERMLKTDPHPLGEARVNEQVKHQAGFAEAFQCKAKDPMALEANQRIKVW
ncbi:MAG: M13 family metallopeptidase [Oligoflexus sp.]